MVLATGSVPGITGSVPGPPGGATGPGGIHGPSVRRDQPLGGLGRLPTKAHAPGEKRGQTLGQMGPKGPCLVRLPLPPHLAATLDGFWGCQHMSFTSPRRSPTSLPSPLSRCLAKPCRIATLLHHHHAVVLLLDGVFLNLSLSPCWIKAWKTSPGCTCVERGGAVVRRLDRNQPRSESLRVRLLHLRSCNASASRSTRVCRCTPLPLVARLLHRLILVMRRKF